MKDELGDRMKEFYENATRFSLLRRSYNVARIDGKAFHTFTRGMKRPFDEGLMDDMDTTASYLCKNIMGAKCAFVQSDEISVVITDFDDLATQAWFGNNLQKMCSISSSMATRAFNEARLKRSIEENIPMKWAEFDSRIFQLPTLTEVHNYLVFRQNDATRNSISSVAQSLYSHKELNGKTGDQKQELIFQKGINWNDYAPKFKRGRLIVKETYEKDGGQRSRWVSADAPIFTQDREFLRNIIPLNS